jgi:hypothetical protein
VAKKFPKYQQLTVIRPQKLPAETVVHELASCVSTIAHIIGAVCVFVPACIYRRRLLDDDDIIRERVLLPIGQHCNIWNAKLLQDTDLEEVTSRISDIQKLHIRVSSETGTGYDLMSLPPIPSLKKLEISYAKAQHKYAPIFSDPLCLKKYPMLKSLTLDNAFEWRSSSIPFLGNLHLGHFLPPQLEELSIPNSVSSLVHPKDLSSILSTCTNLSFLELPDLDADLTTLITPYPSLKTLGISFKLTWSTNPFALFPQLSELRIPLRNGLSAQLFEPSSSLEHLVLTLEAFTIGIAHDPSFFSDLSAKYPKLECITMIFKYIPQELPPTGEFTIIDTRVIKVRSLFFRVICKTAGKTAKTVRTRL